MPAKRTIATNKPTTVVTHVVKVNGSEIPQKYKADVIVITKEVNRIPTAKLVLIDGSASKECFDASNDSLFIPGSEIEILAGYESDNQSVFKGVVIKHSVKIRNNNAVLIVECKDICYRMAIGLKSKYFDDGTKDSDAISEICGAYGLKTDIEDTKVTHKDLVQFNTTDWDFMVSRADVNGKLCIADDGKLNVKKPNLSQSAVLSVLYGATIIELDIEMDSREQYKAVVAKSWSSDDQKVLEKDATNPSLSMSGNITLDDLAKVGKLEKYTLSHSGDIPEPELQAWGEALWQKHQLAKIRGRVRFKGIHTVKPGMIIELNGISDRFNGKCFVGGILHHISAGDWQIDVQIGIDPDWFSRQHEITSQPASGILPAIQGLQIGTITQLEKDPDNRYRIKVCLPMINASEKGMWARVATLDAGKDRGSFFLPEINDEVIVGFINNDPRDAVVLGMVNSAKNAAPLTAEDANNKKGFVTRSKMKMIFDDDEKSFTLETPAGKKIVVDEKNKLIKLEDENSNKIVMDKDGINIESGKDIKLKATGDIKMEGVNVEGKASAAFKSEGSSSLEAKSGGTTTIKGSMVMIN